MERKVWWTAVFCLALCVANPCVSLYAMRDAGYGETIGGAEEPPKIEVPTVTVVPTPMSTPVMTPTEPVAEVTVPLLEEVKPTEGDGEDQGDDENQSEVYQGITNITVDCKCIGVLNEILLELQKNTPAVTALYSENRRIAGCYYRPVYEELMRHTDIAAEVALYDQFAAVYTGYFDLYDPELGETGLYKPEGSQCRELEILGYDFLLSREEYNEGTKEYVATEYRDPFVIWEVAVMDLYKALGKEIISYARYFENDVNAEEGRRVTLENSPIGQSLPSYVSDLDTSRVETHLFVTRTYAVERYYERAVNELGVSWRYRREYMSNSDFVLLVAQAMQMYGEPVMSELEMNLLLQVYGAEIPEYLTETEREAYLYLKARGVLNIDFDFTQPLEFKDMLNILMCVKDQDSRTDFKNIQVTMDIGEDLINRGYFPKTVSIVDRQAPYVEEMEVSEGEVAGEVSYHDYLVLIDENTEFRDSAGQPVREDKIFVSAENGQNEKGARDGTAFLGIEMFAGRRYYHFRVSTEFEGVLEFNTEQSTDAPENIRMTARWVGGGVYSFSSRKKGTVYVQRDKTFKKFAEETGVDMSGYWDKSKLKKSKASASLLDEFFNLFMPTVRAYAAPSVTGLFRIYQSSIPVPVKFKVYNVADAEYTGDSSYVVITDNGDGTWTILTQECYREYVLKHIVRKDTQSATVYRAICNLTGEVLLDYDALVEAGLFYTDVGGQLPTPDDLNATQLTLNGRYGQVRLNSATREIVVGSVLYKLKNTGEDLVMFKFLEVDGKEKLYVDFRVAYGWSVDKADITVLGTGDSYTVSIAKEDMLLPMLREVAVNPPEGFCSVGDLQNPMSMQIIPGGYLHDSDEPCILLSSPYTLTNWLVYQGANGKTGSADEYVYVYYLKSALEDFGVSPPGDQEKLKGRLGYVILDAEEESSSNWCIREFSIDELIRQGCVFWEEHLGYVYKLPAVEEVTLEDYLKGEVLLPICYDKNSDCLRNINVNEFSSYGYGSRPTERGMCYVDSSVTITSEPNPQVTSTSVPSTQVISTPVGIPAYYGTTRKYVPATESGLGVNTREQRCYYGINQVAYGSNSILVRFSYNGSDRTYSVNRQNAGDLRMYLIGVSAGKNSVYSLLSVKLDVQQSEEPVSADIVVETATEVVDAERKDVFTGYRSFSLRLLLDMIDEGASTLIVIVFTVFPMVGVVLLTVLIGLVLAADFKGVRLFAEKVFDPVKLLTFGKRTMESFRLGDCLFSMLVGYTLFALLYDGNLIRILQWVFTLYSDAVQYLKYL